MDEQDYCLTDQASGFRMTIESRCDGLWEAAESIMRTVKTLPCVQAELDDLHLALIEALTNAVLHGNREDPAKTVGVFGGCDGQAQLVIAVTDQGDGFDPAALPDPTAAENVCADHGRGVFLMKRLVDEVEFNLGGRQVILRKRMAGRPKAPWALRLGPTA
jgi:serine/threonine-protein kinase RsbW